jgi:TonB family protein
MRKRLEILTLVTVLPSLLMAQAHDREHREVAAKPCQLVSANPPDFTPFQFVPKQLDFKRLNRFPRVAYLVNEDGSVSGVKIVKGTGSPKADAGLIKSIRSWRYRPQPGCKFEMSGQVIIDIGSQ